MNTPLARAEARSTDPEGWPPVRSERFCALCGRATAQPWCERDGAPTFALHDQFVEGGPLAVGDVLAGYRVLRVLGRGGHATVYLASHPQALGEVALKVLHGQQITPNAIQRFYREARIGARLTHPNTVRVHEVGQADNGLIYLVMELLHGETLAQRLAQLNRAQQRMSAAEAVAIAVEVCKGLADAHEQGIVHRDLKPGNIMLGRAGGDRFVKVLDFGVAHMLDASTLTETGRTIGTPAYMSPEQCRGEELDARSDLYALSVILYQCLAGGVPFRDANVLQQMYAHTALAPPDLTSAAKDVPPGLAAVVLRGLAKSAAERFASAQELRTALEASLGATSVVEPPHVRIASSGDPTATPAALPLWSSAGDAPTPTTRVEPVERLLGTEGSQLAGQSSQKSRPWALLAGLIALSGASAWAGWPAAEQKPITRAEPEVAGGVAAEAWPSPRLPKLGTPVLLPGAIASSPAEESSAPVASVPRVLVARQSNPPVRKSLRGAPSRLRFSRPVASTPTETPIGRPRVPD